jgi:hypothetical protein
VLVVSLDALRQLFSATESAPFRRDLTVAQYKAQVEPELSESRIRELCADGTFPDVEADNETVPGAYKDSRGDWRITPEGIAERQRQERARGVKMRRGPGATARPQSRDDEASGGSAPPKSERGGQLKADRPNRGSWQKVVEERART